MASDWRWAALAACFAAASCTQGPGIRSFEAHLAAHDSATEALRLWCGQQGIAKDAVIRAEPAADAQPAPSKLASLLGVSGIAATGYRHVHLSCGGVVLSDAHNWYVPARLTPDMNRMLSETDTPFGKVAAPLKFRREAIETRKGRGEGCPARTISTHTALLRLPDGAPLALVVECYTRANIKR